MHILVGCAEGGWIGQAGVRARAKALMWKPKGQHCNKQRQMMSDKREQNIPKETMVRSERLSDTLPGVEKKSKRDANWNVKQIL